MIKTEKNNKRETEEMKIEKDRVKTQTELNPGISKWTDNHTEMI